MVLIADAAITGYFLLLFFFSGGTNEQFSLIRSYLLLSGSICLFLAAIIYIGIFAINYTKFLVVVLSFTAAGGLVPMIIMKAYRDRMDIIIAGVFDWLRNINWILAIPLILAAYFGLMCLAAWIKDIRPST